MILNEFAKFLQSNEDKIIEKKSCVSLLGKWVKTKLEYPPVTNVDKVLHAEITLAKNKIGDFMLVAKSESGQTLTSALYNFALSYEQHVLTKWIQNKRPNDFKNVN